MARAARQPPPLGPAAIAIHHNGDMLRIEVYSWFDCVERRH
jgi:hypothetical protein